MSEIVTALTGAAFMTAVLGVVAFLGRQALTEWLTTGVRHAYDVKLEKLKSELQQSVESTLRLQAAVVGAAAAGQAAAFPQRVECLRDLWRLMMAMRRNAPTIAGMTEIMTTDELIDKVSHERDGEQLRAEIDVAHAKMRALGGEAADDLRLLVGAMPWSLFYTYRALIGRTCVYFDLKMDRANRFKDLPARWKDDTGVRQIVGAVLNETELARFTKHDIGGLAYVLAIVESRFIAEAGRVLSGEAAATEMSETAQSILSTVRAAQS